MTIVYRPIQTVVCSSITITRTKRTIKFHFYMLFSQGKFTRREIYSYKLYYTPAPFQSVIRQHIKTLNMFESKTQF